MTLIHLTPDEAREVSGALEVGAEGCSDSGRTKAHEIATVFLFDSRITLAVGEAS